MKSKKMGVVEFVKAYNRMCNQYLYKNIGMVDGCEECPFYTLRQDVPKVYCFDQVLDKPRKALSIVKKYASENPERLEDDTERKTD